MACPPFETLIESTDGRLSTAERETVARHVAGCDACTGTMRWYQSFVVSAAADQSFDPPEWVTRRALRLFEDAREAASRRGVRGLVARLRASLVFDSFSGAASPDSVPARRSGALEARQLLFSASPFDVDMLVAPALSSGRVRVTGQVLSSGEGSFESVSGLRVELASGDEVMAATATTEFGEFTFEDVGAGVYEVRISGERREIVVESAPIQIQ